MKTYSLSPQCRMTLATLHAHQQELQSEWAVKRLALFGSTARNEATETSDIDLLVEFIRPVGLFHYMTVKERLEQWLGRRVDLVTLAALRSPLKEQILPDLIDVC